jgi:probable O-glycosylation ligase (exosortase A-associated)
MRDILLMALVFGSLPFILRRPHIGVLMYVWISVMNPHRLTWSFAYDFNFAAIIAAATLLGVVFSKEVKRPPVNTLTVTLALFAIWTGVTTAFALQPDASFERWKGLVKTELIAFLIPMLFHKKGDLRLLIWVIVLSIGYYGTKGGAWTLLMGGEGRVFGPMGSYIRDNNALAIAIVMTIPLMRYLQLTSPHRYVRWALTVMMLLCGVAVLGTYSRGALLAVCAMVALFWWKGRHRIAVLLLILAAIPFAMSTMPEKWYSRMETIADYEQDSSARMRLNSWGTMWNIARDRPIVGGGFELASKEIYARYSPDPAFPPQVAHSLYLQALGEHGFVGLALYLAMLGALWRTSGNIIRAARDAPELGSARDLALMMQVTLMGFAVGGVFLSLVNFDVPYYLVGIMASLALLVERERRAQLTQATARHRADAPQPAAHMMRL